MSKVLICGDVHGDYRPIHTICQKEESLTDKDTLIILGDFCGNFFLNKRDDEYKKKLSFYKINFFIIRGNHEQRPSICMENNPKKWHMEVFWGNFVYVEDKYPYIKYALDAPAEYKIPLPHGSIKTLVLPGAYSVDKYYRLANHLTWFEEEQLTEDERNAGTQLALSKKWDLILSHTCPISYQPTDLFLSSVDQSMVDTTMERWLGGIEYQTSYKLWCWGHYHSNRIYPQFDESNRLMLFNNCYLDVYKFFNGKYKLINCLTKTSKDVTLVNLNGRKK